MPSPAILALAVTVATVLAVSSAQASSCAQMIARGGRIIDTYVMDFGPSDKLWVYIIRMPDGRADKCTSNRKLTR